MEQWSKLPQPMRSYIVEASLLVPTGVLDVASTMHLLSNNPELIPYEKTLVPNLVFENFGIGWAPFVKMISTIVILISIDVLRKKLEPDNPRFTTWSLVLLNAGNIFVATSNFLQI